MTGSGDAGSKRGRAFGRIAIIGAGMIGGSVGAALGARGLVGERVAYDASAQVREALAPRIADRVVDSVAAACDGAELIVVACPVGAMASVFEAIGRSAPAGSVITDCGSTKQTPIAAARAGLGAMFANYVPGHPIAGSEHSGPAAANASLFDGKAWLLCPVDASQQPPAARLEALLRAIGAIVERMDPAAHDAMFAEFSHWPHALVFAMCVAVARGGHGDLAAHFSGAGLRDTTRIGASAPSLWADILLDNRDAVLACADRFDTVLDEMRARIAVGDRASLVALLGEGSTWRRALDSGRGR